MNQPEDLGTIVRELERRIRVLETTPRIPIAVIQSRVAVTSFVTVTSGTFAPIWEGFMGRALHDAVRVELAVLTDAGTTAEVRLFANTFGSPTTSVLTAPTDSPDRWQFNWVPGWDVGTTHNWTIQVQVRRSSGAGNVYVYQPDQFYTAPSYQIGATETGV